MKTTRIWAFKRRRRSSMGEKSPRREDATMTVSPSLRSGSRENRLAYENGTGLMRTLARSVIVLLFVRPWPGFLQELLPLSLRDIAQGGVLDNGRGDEDEQVGLVSLSFVIL